MCSKRAVPFAALGRMCLKGDVFFTWEVLFPVKVLFGERTPEPIPQGAVGSLFTDLAEGAFAAVLGIHLDFGVTQIPLCWLCHGCVSPRGCDCPMEQFCDLGSHPPLTHNDSVRFSDLPHRELHLLAPLSLLLFAYPTKYSSVTFKTKERDNYKGRVFLQY